MRGEKELLREEIDKIETQYKETMRQERDKLKKMTDL